MKARILSPDEWARVEQETPMPLVPFVDPRNMAVVVVEGDEGIAGTLSTLRVTHLEGLWIKPEFRGNPAVLRALLRHAWGFAEMRDEKWVIGGAARGDTVMQAYCERLGKKMDLDLYAMNLGGM